MKAKRTLKSVLTTLTAGTMMLSAVGLMPASPADAASACTVNTNKTYQIMKGFGGINLPEWITQGDMTDAQVQKAFGNGEDELGFTILRIYCSDDSNAWKNAIPTAKRAQALGATVFATPWNPPAAIRNTVNGGLAGGKYQLKKDKWAEYAQHLNSFVKYVEGQGIQLYSISPQNEPDYAEEWTYWSANDLASFIAQYGKKVTEGTNAKLMSPESFQYKKDIYNAILNNPTAMANTDLFGTHFYGTQPSQMDFPALEQTGKDIWMTEVYVPNSDNNSADRFPEAVKVAENIHYGICNGNLSAYVWWYIRRQYGPMKEDGTISKRGYMMAQYSKWVRPGDVRIDCTEKPNNGVLVSAYKHSDSQITVVAVNTGSTEYSQEFNISGRTITNVDRYRTNGSENIKKTADMEHSTSSFFAQLPANSVSTFVITMEGDGVDVPENPDGPVILTPDEPDDNGYYFEDTFENGLGAWEGRGGASVESSGKSPYEGKEAMLVSGRTASWNGAQRSLSTVTFEPGKEYSFSANVMFDSGAASQKMMLSMQYTDSSGETAYGHIADATAVSGKYVQLANPNYKIPAGASNLQLYLETESGTGNFYVDDVIVAEAGTQIDGPAEVKIMTGDVNGDGKIDARDMTLAKRAAGASSVDQMVKMTADVNGDTLINADDIKWFQQYLTGETDEYPEKVTPPEPEKTPFNYNFALSLKEFPGNYTSAAAVQGKVIEEKYNGINGNKTMYVYLPPNYDESKKYNVFYLMHGGGENEKTLFFDSSTQFQNIFDHMIAAGELEPLIVVTPTFNGCPAPDGNMGAGTVWNEMRQSIVPYVEGKYSTYAASTSLADLQASRKHRAYGGFSMGGGSTWNTLINDLDIFAYFMPLSGHCWGGASAIQEAIDKSGFTQRDYFVFAATGTEDLAHGNMVPLINTLKGDTKRFTYTSDFSKGNFYFLDAPGKTHWWGYVRHYVYDALPYFFHE